MNNHDVTRQCPVCGTMLTQPAASPAPQWPGYQFDCPHCGTFRVDQFEYSHLLGYLNPPDLPGVPRPTPLQLVRHRAVLAHALRRMAASGQMPVLTDQMTLRILQENRLPGIAEQKDNLLRWFAQGAEVGSARWVEYEGLGAQIGSASRGAFRLLLENMIGEGLLRGQFSPLGGGQFSLAPGALDRLEQIERARPSGYNAFMAMQYGDAALKLIVDEYFRQAVRETGFELYRLDDRPEAGLWPAAGFVDTQLS